ncbi:uncharacterized protein [Apostichopus japonicus]|uniref:uncharacterized protein isoform X4 n=1 Tax=Stichopus japonicus TaxID=307972 RepID=UPI003AB2F4BF
MAENTGAVNSELVGGPPNPEGSSNLVRKDEWGSIADILKSIENTNRRPRTSPQAVAKRMPPLTENIQTTPTAGERGQGMQQLDHLLRLMEQMCALRRQNNKLREHAQYLTAIKTLQDIRNEQLLHDCSCEVHRNASDHSSSSSPMDHNLGNIESFSEPESHAGDDEMENKYRSNRSEKRTGRTITREPKGRSVKKRSKSLDPFGEEAEEEMVKERGRPGIFSKFEKMKEKLTSRRGSVKRRSGVKGLDEEVKKYDSELGVPTDGIETKSEDSGFYQNLGDETTVLPIPQRIELPSHRGEEEFSDGEEVFDVRQSAALTQRGESRQVRKVSDVSTGSSSEDFHESKQKQKKYKSQPPPPPPSGSSLSDHNEDIHPARRRRSRFNKSSSFQDFNSSADTDPSPSNLPDPLPVPKRHARLEQSLSMDTEMPDLTAGKLGSQSPTMGSVDSKLGQKRKHTHKAPGLDLSDPLLSSSPESRGGDQLPRSSSPPEKKRNKETKSSGDGGAKKIPSTDMMTMYENIQANLSEDFLSKLEAWDKKKQKEGPVQDMTKQSSVESVSSEPGAIPTNEQAAELLQGLSEEFSKKLATWDKKKKGTVGPSPKGDRKQKSSGKEKKDKTKKDEKAKNEETASQKKVEGEKLVASSRRVVVVENEEGLVKLEGASKAFEDKYREWERMHRPLTEDQKKKEKEDEENKPPENSYPLPAFTKITDSNSCLATPVIVEPHLVPQPQQTKHEMASQVDFPEEVVEPMDDGQTEGETPAGDEPISTLERKNSLLAERLKQKDVNLKVIQSELQVVQEQLEKMAGWKGDEKRHSTCSSIGETSLEAELSEIKSQVQELEEKIQSHAEIRREKKDREEAESRKKKDAEKKVGEVTSPSNQPGKLEAQVQTIQEDETPQETTSNTTEELTKSLQQRENLIRFLQIEVERQRREINFLRSDGPGGAHFKRAKSFSARDRNFDAKAMQVMDIPLGKSLASRGKKDSPNSTPSLSNADSSDQRNRESLSITTESTQSLETLHISAEDIRMEDLGSQTLEQDHKVEETSPTVTKEISPSAELPKETAAPPEVPKVTPELPDVTKDTPKVTEVEEKLSKTPDVTKEKPSEPEKEDTTPTKNKDLAVSSEGVIESLKETPPKLDTKTKKTEEAVKKQTPAASEESETKGSKRMGGKQHPLDAHIPKSIVAQKISSLKSSSASGHSSDSDSKEEKIGTRRQRPEPRWKVKDQTGTAKTSSVSSSPKESPEGVRRSRPRTRERDKKTSSDDSSTKRPGKGKDISNQTPADLRANLRKAATTDKKPQINTTSTLKNLRERQVQQDAEKEKKGQGEVGGEKKDEVNAGKEKKDQEDASTKKKGLGDVAVESDHDSSIKSDTDLKKAFEPFSSNRRDSSDSVSSSRRSSPATRFLEKYDPKFAKSLATNKVEVATVNDLKAKFSGGSDKSGSKSEDEDGMKARRGRPKVGSVKMLSQAFAVSSAVNKETSKGAGGGGTGPSSIRSTPSISPASSCSSLSSSHVSDRIKRLQDRRSRSSKDSTTEKKPVEEAKPPPSPVAKDVPKITPPLLTNRPGYRSSMPNLSAVRAKFEQPEGGSTGSTTSNTGLRVRQKSGSTGKLSFTVSVTETKSTAEKVSEVKPIRARARPPRLVAVIESPGKDKNATETVTVRLRSPTARRSTRTSQNVNNSRKEVSDLHISEPAIPSAAKPVSAPREEDVSVSAPSLRVTSPDDKKPVQQRLRQSQEMERKALSSSDPQIGTRPADGKSDTIDGLAEGKEASSKESNDQSSNLNKSDSNVTKLVKEEEVSVKITQESMQPASNKETLVITGVEDEEERSRSRKESDSLSEGTSPTDKETKSKSSGQSNVGEKGKGGGKGKKGGGGGHQRGDQKSRKSKNGQQQEQSSSSQGGSSGGKEGKSKAKRKGSKRPEQRREQEVNSRNSLDSERRNSRGNDSGGSRSSLNGDNFPDLLAETPKVRDSVIIDDNGNKTRNPRQAVAASALQGAAAAIGHALPDPATRAELEELPGDERRSRKDKTRRGRMLSKADRLSKLDLFRRARSVDTSKAPRDRSPSLERPGRGGRASSMDRSKKRDKSPTGMKGKGKDKDGQRGGWKRILRASNDSLVDSFTDSEGYDSLTNGSANLLNESSFPSPNLHVKPGDACSITEDGNMVVGASVFYC